MQLQRGSSPRGRARSVFGPAIERSDSASADSHAQAHARLIGHRLDVYVRNGLADNVPLDDPVAQRC